MAKLCIVGMANYLRRCSVALLWMDRTATTQSNKQRKKELGMYLDFDVVLLKGEWVISALTCSI